MYAFSCFEKEVEYADEEDTYRIRLTFLGDECEYVLSKIRFLGMRVRIVDGDKLQRRMRESAAKALAPLRHRSRGQRGGEQPQRLKCTVKVRKYFHWPVLCIYLHSIVGQRFYFGKVKMRNTGCVNDANKMSLLQRLPNRRRPDCSILTQCHSRRDAPGY